MSKPKLELSGQDGNAFGILGRASKAARKAGWTQEQINDYTTAATSGDYDHLLQVTMRCFEVDGQTEEDDYDYVSDDFNYDASRWSKW